MFMVRLKLPIFRKQFGDSSELKINFGAGANGKEGWTNVDASTKPRVNCLCDCRYPLPFKSDSARCIYAEHFFEHIDRYDEVPGFLKECLRVLRSSGTIRIIVPDAGLYLQAYSAEGWLKMEHLRGLTPDHRDRYFPIQFKTKMEVVNFVFRQGAEHKFAYDFQTLRTILEDSGFVDVQQMEYQVSRDDVLQIDQSMRQHESLYVEARKP